MSETPGHYSGYAHDPALKDPHYCFHTGVEGRPGRPGAPGENGYSPTVEIVRVQDGHEVRITDLDGVHAFQVMDGADGAQGPRGDTGPQGPKGDRGDAAVVLKSVTLNASWSGNGPYTQAVTVTGYTVTANSKVDLQPDATAIAQLAADGVQALYIVNNNGTLTAYAVGAAPTAALTLQCTVTEVAV